MKTAVVALALLASPLFALDSEECAAYRQLGTLYAVRNILLAGGSSYDLERFIDTRVDELREPMAEGEYRWVQWVRPSDDAPVDKHGHNVVAAKGDDDSDRFEAAAGHAFAVRVVVPRKRSLFGGNNRVYVGTVRVRATIGGRVKSQELAINQWMNPDTSRSIDLAGIAEHAEASVDAATDRDNVKEALVELHFVQAVARDDPENPAYPTIQALRHIRSNADPITIDEEIAALERSLFPGLQSMPVLSILEDFRQADTLMRSKKEKEQEKGEKLLRETLRRLR